MGRMDGDFGGTTDLRGCASGESWEPLFAVFRATHAEREADGW